MSTRQIVAPAPKWPTKPQFIAAATSGQYVRPNCPFRWWLTRLSHSTIEISHAAVSSGRVRLDARRSLAEPSSFRTTADTKPPHYFNSFSFKDLLQIGSPHSTSSSGTMTPRGRLWGRDVTTAPELHPCCEFRTHRLCELDASRRWHCHT